MPRAGRVYDSERAQAIRYNTDIDYVTRIARIAALRVMRRARQAIIAAYRAHRDPASAIIQPFKQLQPIIGSAMLYAKLRGMERAHKDTTGGRGVPVALSDSALDRAVKFQADRFALSAEEISAMSDVIDPLVLKVVDTASDAARVSLAQTMSDITMQGLHVREGAAALREAFTNLGLDASKPYQLEAIMRTQTQLAYAAGQGEVYNRPHIDEILWGYKYCTAGDDRVRIEHMLMDGTCLPKDDPFWNENSPPCGWGCRCVKIPIFEERVITRPEPVEINGRMYYPRADVGFRFDPAKLLAA